MRVRVVVRVFHALVVLVQSPCVINRQIVPTIVGKIVWSE